MTVRPISPPDYPLLAQSGGYASQYGKNIQRWLDKGYVEAPDCYVFEAGGALIGGVCFCDDTETDREILDFAINEIGPDAYQYLKLAAGYAAKPQTRKISYNLYNDTEQYADIVKIFHQCGFTTYQEKLRYEYQGPPPPSPAVLNFKPVSEVGEAAFTAMVEGVTVGIMDKIIAEDAARLGGQKAAQEYVDGLKKMDFNPNWWCLGYAGDEAVGLILPQKFSDDIGAINYVGVLPKHRGKGYGVPLLAEGTRMLIESGVKKVIADIDVENKPMINAFESVGYAFRMEEVVLTLEVFTPKAPQTL